MASPQTFADVINLWPSAVALAEDVGVKEVTARAWRARGIPAEYWTGVVAAALVRGFEGVTLELLAELAAAQGGRAASEQEAAE